MRTCVITGAGTGIGKATAIAISKRADVKNIVLISMGMDDLVDTKEFMDQTKNIDIYDQDITDYEKMQKIVDFTAEKYGSVDVLLNIAGYAKALPFGEIPLENWEKTFNVNVTALFMLSQMVFNHMKDKGGIILNVASTSGSTPRPGWLAYAASKSAVIGISRTLTEELKDHKIRVYNISPGRCATAMRKAIVDNEDLEKIMQPEEVADVISNMLTIEENCLDGQDIVVRKMIRNDTV